MSGLTKEQADELQTRVVRHARPAMARTTGDRTSRQYDRADEMAEGIALAVRVSLREMKLRPEEE